MRARKSAIANGAYRFPCIFGQDRIKPTFAAFVLGFNIQRPQSPGGWKIGLVTLERLQISLARSSHLPLGGHNLPLR